MKILVIVAHPDDEVLGMGGPIKKLTKKGNHVKIVIMATGIAARRSSKFTNEFRYNISKKDSQKIDAFQSNNNLLLSEEATIDSKPQLEIYADDVKCSHGCTIGQLDEDALFYMRSRGVGVAEAKAVLTYAFASEAINNITILIN